MVSVQIHAKIIVRLCTWCPDSIVVCTSTLSSHYDMRHICMPSPRTIVMALVTSSRADVVLVSGVVHEDRAGDR